MADRAKKKEKHRLKRAKKQQAIRKAASFTPLQLISRNAKQLQCLLASAQGLASLFVFGTAMDGRHALSVFLIDKWCVGLKDAYGWPTITREQYERMIEKAGQAYANPLESIDAEEARKLVASAIRFSRQNGFKLPPNWDKWVSILGGLGDIANADLSDFTNDGKLLYIGDKDFLEKRLIGCTPQEFFARTGGDYVLGLGSKPPEEFQFAEADHDDNEETVEFQEEDVERINRLSSQLSGQLKEEVETRVASIIDALRRENVAPHSRLVEGVGYIASYSLTAKAMMSLDPPQPALQFEDAVEILISQSNEPDPDSLWDAIDQALEYGPEVSSGADSHWSPALLSGT